MLVNVDCPVEWLDHELYKSKKNGNVHCSLTFNNLSQQTVKGLKVIIFCYDQFGDPIDMGRNDNGFEYEIEFKEGLPPNCKRATDNKIVLSGYQNTRKIEVDILKVLFDDQSLWAKDTTESEKVELIKIENRVLLKFVQERAGADAAYFARQTQHRWTCVCGRLNRDTQPNCKRCSRGKEDVLTSYNDEATISHHLKIRKQKMKKMMKYSSYAAVVLLVVGGVFYGYKTKFTFSTVEDQKVREVLAADGIIDTSFIASEGSDGRGEFVIKYNKNGVVKNKVISDTTEPRIIDIDSNGVNEIVFTYTVAQSDQSKAQTFGWDDIYDFDIVKEELTFASSEYPDYYRNHYMPVLKKRSAESNDPLEKQALSVLLQAAEGIIQGNFIPDANQKEITLLMKANESSANPLKISKQDNTFYIQGVTLGMSIKEAIQILGEPNETFEINSKVAIWYLENDLKLTAEYAVAAIHYIDLGEFDQKTLEQSRKSLGEPTEKGQKNFSYITTTQALRFHEMVEPGDFRVQLMAPDSP
ncbi:hypothetical protein PAECIP111893_01495 [Paenibacillus plantiphilus]|uniref:Uncharacterized protein n=1 Tax=Paenibacillus plantiphilus TaxID=2905650 RepID=A0ABN8G6C9_9BACL|nr:hypothetical protein [Paenibacillus plantiphilus]CAH1200607.1 hypothetical protein PAECIP111893_01495 [Paenibacillus plantiphilus]